VSKHECNCILDHSCNGLYHLIELLLCFTHVQEDFSVSVWTRNIWKLLKHTIVDGERFEMKTPFSNVSGLMCM